GLGGGIYALGALSDALAPLYGTDALRYAMLAGLGLYAVAALLVGLAGPHLRRDWVDRPSALE
ncbi:MFS transporter, partial [Sphingomonas sp. RB1R13]